MLTRLKSWARAMKRDTPVLYLVVRDPRTPWYAKAVAGLVVGYALSPIDLIPDFIPVIGLLDDLLLVPAGLYLAMRLVPAAVAEECRVRAASIAQKPTSRSGAIVVLTVWLALAGLTAWSLWSAFGR